MRCLSAEIASQRVRRLLRGVPWRKCAHPLTIPHCCRRIPFSHSTATQEEELKDAILLIFANKQDQKGAYNAAQITEAMELSKIKNRQWSIQETAAIKGQGMFEGFDWLVTCIKGE